jgi:hypothetical protein
MKVKPQFVNGICISLLFLTVVLSIHFHVLLLYLIPATRMTRKCNVPQDTLPLTMSVPSYYFLL